MVKYLYIDIYSQIFDVYPCPHISMRTSCWIQFVMRVSCGNGVFLISSNPAVGHLCHLLVEWLSRLDDHTRPPQK